MKEMDERSYEGSEMHKQYEIAEILRPGRESLSTLLALWDEMGIDPSQREKRLHRVQETVSNLLHDLLAEERETKRAIVEQIEHLRRRIEDLTRELGVSSPKPPDPGLSMVKLEKELHMRLSGLKERKQQRLAHVEALRRRDAVCAARLGEEPFRLALPEGVLPSTSQVSALEGRVEALTTDMDHRMSEVRRLRDLLQDCLHDLDLEVPEDYAKWALTAEPAVAELFPLTLPSLMELEGVLKKYQHRRDTAAERFRELMTRIELLWKRLGSNEEERRSFLESLPSSQPASLHVLEAEALRLDELKQQNVAHFIAMCKDELKQIRERCYISVEEMEEWDAAAAEENSPDVLLERYEAEIAHLKGHYEEHEATFVKVTNWNSSFEKLRITELRMKDPSVLSNRGGVLLKYEKTKRAALKTLKALEVGMGGAGNVRIEGLPVLTYIERRRQAYEEEKENEKRQRQEKANVILKNESRFGCKPILTPTRKRTLGATNTPTSGMTFGGSHEQSKLRKITNNACQQFRLKLASCAFATPEPPRTPRSRLPSSVPRLRNTAAPLGCSTPRSGSSVSSGRSKTPGPPPGRLQGETWRSTATTRSTATSRSTSRSFVGSGSSRASSRSRPPVDF